MSDQETLRQAARVARDGWAEREDGPLKHMARPHLAVADWLDGVAMAIEMDDPRLGAYPMEAETNNALAVARAYLGATR